MNDEYFESIHVLRENLLATVSPGALGEVEVQLTLKDAASPSFLVHWGVLHCGQWESPPAHLWPEGSNAYNGEGGRAQAARTPLRPSREGVHVNRILIPAGHPCDGISFVLWDPRRGYDNNAGRNYHIPLEEAHIIRARGADRTIAVETVEFLPPRQEDCVLPHFPLTVSLVIRCTPCDGVLAGTGGPDWFRAVLRPTAFAEFVDPDGACRKVPLRDAPSRGDRTVMRGTFIPTLPGPHRYRIVLEIGRQRFCVRSGDWRVVEPWESETWTSGPMITEIEPGIFIGNAASATNPRTSGGGGRGLLEVNGIGAVLNASEERDPSPALTGTGIEYRSIPFRDFSTNPMDGARIREAVQWIHDLLSSGTRVLVHCHAGIGRSGSLVVSYLFLFSHVDWSFEEIVSMVNGKLSAKRHRIYPHQGLEETLRELRKQIPPSH